MSSVIYTIPPNLPLEREPVARPCLALLRNLNDGLEVVDKSVINFDMVSYYNGQLRLSVFCLYAYYSPTGRIGA